MIVRVSKCNETPFLSQPPLGLFNLYFNIHGKVFGVSWDLERVGGEI